MPSPLGHALGGLAVGVLAAPARRWEVIAACTLAGALADADFLLPLRHRGASHGVGAAVIVGVLALASLKASRARDAFRIASVVTVAYATHILLDWLGADSSIPRGLMALWPFSSDYFVSDLNVFDSVDRRYWREGFWERLARTLARELAILLPAVGAAWLIRRRREPRAQSRKRDEVRSPD
jgi:inner membrane protein